ncbi:glycoprotein-N-acetylgalactosamine 3-beta-galactosyltransferase 1-like [Ptychodera flava]|uniref:glycoprotein-N-acetylgalactosamine 3-beta-galactosyltransferase 1-like n=1 Tax=Ptychodera flava TaxID=63121 RepID=UPI003969E294
MVSSESSSSTIGKKVAMGIFLGVGAFVILLFAYGGHHHTTNVDLWFVVGLSKSIGNSSGDDVTVASSGKRVQPPYKKGLQHQKVFSLPVGKNETFDNFKKPVLTTTPGPEPTISPYCRALLAKNHTALKNYEHLTQPYEAPEKFSSPEELTKNVRILCWVATSPLYAGKRLPYVRDTWGPRCDKTLYFSSFEDKDFPIIKLDVPEGHSFLWGKTKAAFRYAYEHHFNEFDWFVKADDDTYLIVENLRYLLSQHDPNKPSFLGHTLINRSLNLTFVSGGAGYALSRTALQRFVECGVLDSHSCNKLNVGREDVEMAFCLRKFGVTQIDSRDPEGKPRFIPFDPAKFLNGKVDAWYHGATYYPYKTGKECCSKYAISFHYVKPELMQVLDYLIHDVRLYLVTGDGSFT